MFTLCTCIHHHISNYTSTNTTKCLQCVSQELGGVFQSGVFRVSIMPTQRSCGPSSPPPARRHEAGSSTPQLAFHPAKKADINDCCTDVHVLDHGCQPLVSARVRDIARAGIGWCSRSFDGAILDPVHNTVSQQAHLRALDTLDSDDAGVHNPTILKEMLQVAQQPDLADTILENSLRVSVQKELG